MERLLVDTSFSLPTDIEQSQQPSRSSEHVGRHSYDSDEQGVKFPRPESEPLKDESKGRLDRMSESGEPTADTVVGHSSCVDKSGGANWFVPFG